SALVYAVAPDRVFRDFRKTEDAFLKAPVPAEAPARQLSFRDIVERAEGAGPAKSFSEPYLHATDLQRKQLLLAQMGARASLLQSALGERFVDVVTSEAQAATGRSATETPPNA